jgi:hypothetical protein
VKVSELIAALQAQDPDLPVIMPGEDVDFCEVATVFVDTVGFCSGEVQLADERDSAITPVVRLFGSDVEEGHVH